MWASMTSHDVCSVCACYRGGSSVVGIGRYMDSVARPMMVVTLIYKDVRNTIPRTAQVIMERYEGVSNCVR